MEEVISKEVPQENSKPEPQEPALLPASNDVSNLSLRATDTAYTIYIIKSPLFSGDLERRYSDFFALREKLLRNYPGIYIPNIPPKVYVNNKKETTITLRQRTLTNFCTEISKIPILLESPEVQAFFSQYDTSNVVQTKIKTTPDLQYFDILNNYRKFLKQDDNVILNDENNSNIISFTQVQEYLAPIESLYNVIVASKEKVNRIVNEEKAQIVNEMKLFMGLEDYEKKILIECIENNDIEKLVFFSSTNSMLVAKIHTYTKDLIPHNQILLEYLEDKELDLLSLKEMYNSYKGLLTRKAQYENDVEKLKVKLQNIKAGKRDFLEIITFKKPEVILNQTEMDLNSKSNDIVYLNEILQLLSLNIKNKMSGQLECIKKSFYEMLKVYLNDGVVNYKKKEDFWSEAKSVQEISFNEEKKDNEGDLI